MTKTATQCNSQGCVIKEEDFFVDQALQNQSIYTLCNGVISSRGFLEERTAVDGFVSNYIRGLYEIDTNTRKPFLVNAVNFWDIEMYLNGSFVDLTSFDHTSYSRELSLENGQLTRQVTWDVKGIEFNVKFCRFLDMQHTARAYQQIVFTANKPCSLKLVANMRFDEKQQTKQPCFTRMDVEDNLIICKTPTTNIYVGGALLCDIDGTEPTYIDWDDKVLTHTFEVDLTENKPYTFTRYSAVVTGGGSNKAQLLQNIVEASQETFFQASERNKLFWQQYWQSQTLPTTLDEQTEQGVRFALFQLAQSQNLVTAKTPLGSRGLVAGNGSTATWHNELILFPYFLQHNQQKALDMLLYRFDMLKYTTALAKQANCVGSRFPVSTLCGEESSQNSTFSVTNLLPTLAVAWAMEQYANATNNKVFSQAQAPAMMIQIARYLASRGTWNNENTCFSFYCVSGADTLHPLQNHNYLINFMAQQALRFALKLLKDLPPKQLVVLQSKTGFTAGELASWKKCADSILLVDKQGILQQFEGYDNLPNVSHNQLANAKSLQWDVLCRTNGLSTSDVILLFALYPNNFSADVVEQNLQYYLPNVLHLDCVNFALLATVYANLGNKQLANEYFHKACRLDLDNLLDDTQQGLHTHNCFAVAHLLDLIK